jgi:hypothetical protein
MPLSDNPCIRFQGSNHIEPRLPQGVMVATSERLDKLTFPTVTEGRCFALRGSPRHFDDVMGIIERDGSARVYFGEPLTYERGAATALWRVLAADFTWLTELYTWWGDQERIEPVRFTFHLYLPTDPKRLALDLRTSSPAKVETFVKTYAPLGRWIPSRGIVMLTPSQKSEQLKLQYEVLHEQMLNNETLALQSLNIMLVLTVAIMTAGFSQFVREPALRGLLFYGAGLVAFLALFQNAVHIGGIFDMSYYISRYVEPQLPAIHAMCRLWAC